MKFDCDLTLPAEQRYLSEKYRLLSRNLNAYRLDLAHALELAALLHTPGVTDNQLSVMFRWSQHGLEAARLIKSHYVQAIPMGQENAQGMTLDDGRALLQAMLDAKPGWAHTVPLYATRYLQARRASGHKSTKLAEEFQTTPARIQRWWSADVFDPLSGAERPKGSTHRNRPLSHQPHRRRMGLAV